MKSVIIYVYYQSESSTYNLIFFVKNELSYQNNIDYIIVINGFEYHESIIFPDLDNLTIIKRHNIGFDFGGHNAALNHISSNNKKYDYYFFMNSGVIGPIIPIYHDTKVYNIQNNFTSFATFDWRKYVSYYPDLSIFLNKEDAWNHWLNSGKNEGRIFFKLYAYELFDWVKYVSYYPDLSIFLNKEDAWNHWLNSGKNEGRIYFQLHWTRIFIKKINDRVKLVGTTIVCLPHEDSGGYGPKIEGFCFMTDQIGLYLLQKEKTIFCDHSCFLDDIINGEYGLSKCILKNGYSIDCMLDKYNNINWRNSKNYKLNNNKHPSRENSFYNHSINPYEVIFHKWFWKKTPSYEEHTVNFDMIKEYVNNI